MPLHVRGLVREVAIYGSGRTVLQVMSFITLPLFTRTLSPEDYGVIETIGTLTSVVALVAILGLDLSSERSFFDYGVEATNKRRAVVSTAFWALLVWSTGLVLCLVAASSSLARWLFGDTLYGSLIAIALVVVLLRVLTDFCLDWLRRQHRPLRYSLLSCAGGAGSTALALYLVVFQRLGLLGYYAAFVVSSVLVLGAAYWSVRPMIARTFDRRELRTMLRYGLPLLPVMASNWVIQLADRLFLLHFAPLSEVGLYGLGVRLSNLLLMAITAFCIAWSPYFLELHREDPLRERQVRALVLTHVTVSLCFGALCLTVFAREFFLTVTAPAFVAAYSVVGLLSACNVLIGINAITQAGITVSRRTFYFTQYALISMAFNLGLNWLLIPLWGMVGAALATLLTYTILASLCYWRAQRLDPTPYDSRRLGAILLVTALLGGLGTIVNVDPLWLSVVVKAPLLVAFGLFVWRLGALDPRLFASLRHATQRFGVGAKAAP
jgi:O-antigen/teichoic acid export membrane protein